MKLEPLKAKNLPKYAAALAAAASAVLLTGCHPAGDVAISDAQVVTPDITEQIVPDESSGSDALLILDGEAKPEPDDGEEITLAGVIDVNDDCSGGDCSSEDDPDPLTLEGDVVWIPDYQDATDNALSQLTDDRLQVYMDAFADAGLPMERITERFSHYGTNFTAVLQNAERGTAVAFFDGTATDRDGERDINMFDFLTNSRTSGYEWGCVLKNINYKDEFSEMILIDLSKEPADIAAFAAQIAKDVTK